MRYFSGQELQSLGFTFKCPYFSLAEIGRYSPCFYHDGVTIHTCEERAWFRELLRAAKFIDQEDTYVILPSPSRCSVFAREKKQDLIQQANEKNLAAEHAWRRQLKIGDALVYKYCGQKRPAIVCDTRAFGIEGLLHLKMEFCGGVSLGYYYYDWDDIKGIVDGECRPDISRGFSPLPADFWKAWNIQPALDYDELMMYMKFKRTLSTGTFLLASLIAQPTWDGVWMRVREKSNIHGRILPYSDLAYDIKVHGFPREKILTLAENGICIDTAVWSDEEECHVFRKFTALHPLVIWNSGSDYRINLDPRENQTVTFCMTVCILTHAYHWLSSLYQGRQRAYLNSLESI